MGENYPTEEKTHYPTQLESLRRKRVGSYFMGPCMYEHGIHVVPLRMNSCRRRIKTTWTPRTRDTSIAACAVKEEYVDGLKAMH